MRKIKVFVSSPGDLSFERKRLQEIVIGLNGDYVGVAQIELYLWEESFYSAEATYQKQIPPTFDSDIVISMFWTRLGKELPAGFLKETLGETAFSGEMTGSTYELMTALEAARSGKPKVFVFRKTEEPTYKLTDAKEHERAVEDWNKVEDFFSANFKDPDRGLIPYEELRRHRRFRRARQSPAGALGRYTCPGRERSHLVGSPRQPVPGPGRLRPGACRRLFRPLAQGRQCGRAIEAGRRARLPGAVHPGTERRRQIIADAGRPRTAHHHGRRGRGRRCLAHRHHAPRQRIAVPRAGQGVDRRSRRRARRSALGRRAAGAARRRLRQRRSAVRATGGSQPRGHRPDRQRARGNRPRQEGAGRLSPRARTPTCSCSSTSSRMSSTNVSARRAARISPA